MLACSSTDGRLDCAHLVALENSAALDICERYLFGSLLPSLLGRAVTDTGDPEWRWTWPTVKSPPPSPTWLPGQGRERGGSQAPPILSGNRAAQQRRAVAHHTGPSRARACPAPLPAGPGCSKLRRNRKCSEANVHRVRVRRQSAAHARPWLEEGGPWSPGARSAQPPSAPAGGVTSLCFSVVSHRGRTPA